MSCLLPSLSGPLHRHCVTALTVIAMTVLGIAVIVTHGSVIDEKATSSEDWVFTVVFAVLSVILAPTAVCRVRRLRHARSHSRLPTSGTPIASVTNLKLDLDLTVRDSTSPLAAATCVPPPARSAPSATVIQC